MSRVRRRIRLFGALVVASLALLCAACTSTPPPVASPSPALPDGVTVRIFQNRFDYADRVLELSITNDSQSEIEFVSASFMSPHFTDAASYTKDLVLAPGQTRDLRVHLAKPVCTGDLDAPEAVTLTWVISSGGTASAIVSPLDDTGAIERITREDCLNAAVDSVVTITPATELRVEGAGAASVAWVDLSLTPTGASGTVTIAEVGDTVLLASASGLTWPVEVSIDSTSPPATISLDLRPTRCDPHAVAEDKRGTVFPLAVTTSAGPSGTYNLTVSDALRGQIYAWIAAHCGF